MQQPPNIKNLLKTALAEDIGAGDITSKATVPAAAQGRFVMRARQELVVCGLVYLPQIFALIDKKLRVNVSVGDGTKVLPGAMLATLEGPARALLAGERTALNLVQQLSGVATLTHEYVETVAGTGAIIVDTRKTVPGLREVQKYAVACGGGGNHRMGLFDAVLIKDNHIAITGSVSAAVAAAKSTGKTVEVECDTLEQVDEAIAARADMVLLDNMEIMTLSKAVERAKAAGLRTEASGNVSLKTVRSIAQTGVDWISVGKLTHSAPSVDIGLDEA